MDDKGSIIVEMCFIAPFLVGIVFVVINLFVVVMNYAVAAGEAYTVLYNREEYILVGDAGDSATAERVMTDNVENGITFAGQVDAKSYMTDEGFFEHGAVADSVLGVCVNEISYTEKYPGISYVVKDDGRRKTVTAKREIRNTGNNLRRWQTYGKLLSE